MSTPYTKRSNARATPPLLPPPQDYHIPVEGGVGAKPHPLHVVHVAVEMAPIAKVRALWCVVGMRFRHQQAPSANYGGEAASCLRRRFCHRLLKDLPI